MTGIRQEPIYRRRVRGAHKGLKRMLVEGMADGDDKSRTWTRFSGAMVRQAVDEAVSSLPPREKQLLKLAYFSDLTNREIAQGLGITLSSVERGLRDAIARVSEYVERGKGAGRKAIYAIGLFLAGRQVIKPPVQSSRRNPYRRRSSYRSSKPPCLKLRRCSRSSRCSTGSSTSLRPPTRASPRLSCHRCRSVECRSRRRRSTYQRSVCLFV